MKRFVLAVSIGVITLAPLSGCERFQSQQDTFQTALRHMCEFHRLEIVQTLLTEQQKQAGRVVCAAVGMGLGT